MSRYHLKLTFSAGSPAELEHTEFVDTRLQRNLSCYRGSAFSLPHSVSGFRWSSAVQALCVLLLRYRALPSSTELDDSSQFLLIGESGSLAASLDYAISKQPAWLQDMFGVQAQGQLVARDFILRSNSERKRPGPVRLAIDVRKLPQNQLRIYYRGREIKHPNELLDLSNQIEHGNTTRPQGRIRQGKVKDMPLVDKAYSAEHALQLSPQSCQANPKTELSQKYFDEIFSALRNTVVFDSSALRSRLTNLSRREELRRRYGRGIDFTQLQDFKLHGCETIGQISDELIGDAIFKSSQPIRVAIPCGEASTQALLTHLKRQKQYPIEIVQTHPHAQRISQEMRRTDFCQQFDLALLSLASGADYSAYAPSKGFRPYMVMPTISYELLASAEHATGLTHLEERQVVYIDGAASYTACLYERLRSQNPKNQLQAAAVSSQFDLEIDVLARKPNLEILLWFPFTDLLRQHSHVATQTVYAERSELLLFASDQFLRDSSRSKAVAAAIRAAWLQLLYNPFLLKSTIAELLEGDVDDSSFGTSSPLERFYIKGHGIEQSH